MEGERGAHLDKLILCPLKLCIINVRARNLSSTSILVQLGEVPDTDENGIILSYTVNYEANPEVSLQQSQVVNASIREVTLTGLDKNTEYKIMLFANTSKGGGSESEPVTVKTDEDSISIPLHRFLPQQISYEMQNYPN